MAPFCSTQGAIRRCAIDEDVLGGRVCVVGEQWQAARGAAAGRYLGLLRPTPLLHQAVHSLPQLIGPSPPVCTFACRLLHVGTHTMLPACLPACLQPAPGGSHQFTCFVHIQHIHNFPLFVSAPIVAFTLCSLTILSCCAGSLPLMSHTMANHHQPSRHGNRSSHSSTWLASRGIPSLTRHLRSQRSSPLPRPHQLPRLTRKRSSRRSSRSPPQMASSRSRNLPMRLLACPSSRSPESLPPCLLRLQTTAA